jgi:glycosyltransferase involved in cell wall biosynthesis
VAIPALNEAGNIGRCLDSLREHLPRDIEYEIVVGDHGSRDATVGIAESKGARVMPFRGGTVGDLRNHLVAGSRGDVLIFLDADTSVTADWGANLPAALRELARDPMQITGSLCVVPDDGSPFIKYWFSKIKRKETAYLGTGHLIVSRLLFEKLGGFAPGLRSGEDFDFCQRARAAGAALNIRAELRVVHHEYPLNARQFLRREAWHGAGDFQSPGRILRSKVALSALLFLGLQTLSLALLAWNWRYFVAVQFVSLSAIAAQSWLKFRGLSGRERVANIAIFHLYLAGRCLAMLGRTRTSTR